jgi:hypothetical protein
MTDKNHKTDWQRGAYPDELDQRLDSALAKYAAAEPRQGLEERILSALHTQRAHPRRDAWRWSWAVAAAVVVVGTLLVWNSARKSAGPAPAVATHLRAVETQNPTEPMPQLARSGHEPKVVAAHRPGVRPRVRPHSETVAVDPKLDVFPSPQPLSEEELALVRLVRNFPREARLVAQAQEASAAEMLAKMQKLADESN